MYVAICDDNTVFAEYMCRALEQYSCERQLDLLLDTFTSGEELIENCKRQEDNERYHLVLLDIDLPGLNGMETAQTINNLYTTNIVFVSSHIEYASHGYSFDTFHYIYKPQFEQVIGYYLAILAEKERRIGGKLLLNCVKGDVVVQCSDIIYCMSELHKLYITMAGAKQPYCTYMKLDELEQLLPVDCFYRTHKSYLVNLCYVKKISGYKAHMSTGQVLPIPKMKYAMVKQRYVEVKGDML